VGKKKKKNCRFLLSEKTNNTFANVVVPLDSSVLQGLNQTGLSFSLRDVRKAHFGNAGSPESSLQESILLLVSKVP
jgi:hypothetical protein